MSGPAVRIGFFGKLPSRGDFVRVCLSRAATAGWDEWLQSVMPGAQAHLDEHWAEIWQATHPWRFAFEPGVCGPLPVSGIWLPSADRVGRTFPLMIAAEAATMTESFLDEAESIGADAIRSKISPETLAHRLDLVPRPLPAGPSYDGVAVRWWRRRGTDGGEVVQGDTLPDTDMFVRMLTA
jgi:type VI secretion system protein ImpM